MEEEKKECRILSIKLTKKNKAILGGIISFFLICTIGFFVSLGILLTYKSGKVESEKVENVQKEKETQGKEDKIVVEPVSERDIVIGNQDAEITWYVYDDLECPFCKKFQPTVKKILKEYKGKIRLVFRHFPLFSLHPTTGKKAKAIECMREMRGNEKAFSLVDKIYEKADMYGKLSMDEVIKLGVLLGVDKKKFESCINSSKYDSYIKEAYEKAVAAGGQGTPYSILENKQGKRYQIPGAYPYEYVKQVVEELLK